MIYLTNEQNELLTALANRESRNLTSNWCLINEYRDVNCQICNEVIYFDRINFSRHLRSELIVAHGLKHLKEYNLLAFT